MTSHPCPQAPGGAAGGTGAVLPVAGPGGALVAVDPTIPNPARIYDYLLGGKDHFPCDRDAAEQILAVVPQAREVARANRAFLQRAVRFLARQGIRQFMDVGTGLPTQGNVHEIAQAVAPDARVVYVDYDPVVYVHANALLADQQTTIAVQADLRQPEAILQHPKVRHLLDFAEPVGLLLVAVLHFVPDADDPAGIVARVRDALAPGSFVVISHASGDFDPELAARVARIYQRASAPLILRSRAEIERFFEGFQFIKPGLVEVGSWHPDPDPGSTAPGRHDPPAGYAGVGRKPPTNPDCC